ncbi:MAG: hypothetical protein QOH61_403 [Chloroflexota bacterium]|jgi:cytoskeletal protein CcmA (bactofilin family)|nr:hypothetical protein [Chloroflexota bacterium]
MSMFSRHNERQAADDRQTREEQRPGGLSAIPTTGMRDAVAVPVASESAVSSAGVASTASTSATRSPDDSVLGREDRFEGTLRSQRGLRILGQFQGNIEAATSVLIEEGARVEADLTADEAIIAGEYTGKLVCRQRLEVRSTGQVKGEIETLRLMLHEGGYIDGALHMQKSSIGRDADAARSTESSSTTELSRGSDSVRAGVAPRTSIEVEPEREPAAAPARGSGSSGSRASSR